MKKNYIKTEIEPAPWYIVVAWYLVGASISFIQDDFKLLYFCVEGLILIGTIFWIRKTYVEIQ